MKLPPAPWLDAPSTQRILAALDAEGGMVRAVGGAVRDALLEIPVADVDLATKWQPTETVRRLRAAGIKAVPTGIAHGTVTAVADGHAIEVTTLRRDVATDGRHAQVEFSSDWRDDAARRDFTINALYADPVSRDIEDYFDGLADLGERRVRFIGDPATRIAEDHLRILRFFRFHARFGRGDPDAGGLAACAAHANDLMALSRERIAGEVAKLLGFPDPVAAVRVMLANGIFAPVLPELRDVERLVRLVASESATGHAPHWLRRLAALLPADADILDGIAVRLRLSKHERKRLVAMATPPEPDARAEAYRDGADTAVDRRLLADAPAAALVPLTAWVRPQLPITGRALIARGVAPGPDVSRKLGWFERAWVAAGFPVDFAELVEAAVKEG